MIESTPTAREPLPAPAVAPPAPASRDASRIDWLFRDALRNQQLHPLMELVRRYRDQAAP